MKSKHIHIQNCKSCRTIDRDALKFGTEIIAMQGHWHESKDSNACLDQIPKPGKTYKVGLNGPLEFHLGQPIWILYTDFEYLLNGRVSADGFDKMRFCLGTPTSVVDLRSDGVDIRFRVLETRSLQQVLESSAEAAPQNHWQFYLDAVGKHPATRPEQHGAYRYVSADSQGDVGYDMVFLPFGEAYRLVFMRDWSMHEQFYYGGNFRIGENAQAALSLPQP